MDFSLESFTKKPSKSVPAWAKLSDMTLILYNATLELIDIQQESIERSPNPKALLGRHRTIMGARIAKHARVDPSNLRKDRLPSELFIFIEEQNARLNALWKNRCENFTNKRKLLKTELENIYGDLKAQLAIEKQRNLRDYCDQTIKNGVLERQQDIVARHKSLDQDYELLQEKCANLGKTNAALLRELASK